MAALFQKFQIIFFLVIFTVGNNCVSTQSDERNSVGNTVTQGPLYYFYHQPEHLKDCKDVVNQCSSSTSSGTHVIKPTGYMNAFEVYCKKDGWTVIQRRFDGSISFDRNWTEFKNGFGFLSSEFWIGNEKLSYLTEQAVYELQIDIELSNGSSLYLNYSSFRVGDEWSLYALVSIGSYSSYSDNAVTYCPLNMMYGACSCQPTCSEPNNTTTCVNTCVEVESCVCANGFLKEGDGCVPPNECECFVTEINKVIPNGDWYVNTNCSVNYTCHENLLDRNSNYRCSINAECREENGVRQCFCNEGYEGDGETCSPMYTDCYDAYQAGHREDGVYTIFPSGWPGSPFNVSCVMSTNGGGWTVFQRRTDGVSNFYQNWTSYRYGFGSFDGDFWLGNEQLHYLTNQRNYKLRIDIVTSGGSSKYYEYSSFRINDNNNKFRIDNIGDHRGTAGNGMQYTHRRFFSTYDQDNDGCGNHNCAQGHRGAWWYHSNFCTDCVNGCSSFPNGRCGVKCTTANLNGDYDGGRGENIFWRGGTYCNINFAEMKIRPS